MKAEELKKYILEAKRKQERKNKNKEIEWIRPPKEKGKKFTFRILPYTEEQDFALIKYIHWGVGERGITECLRTDECPICQVLNKYPFEKIKRFLPKGQVYFNIQIPEEPEKVYLISLGISILTYLYETAKGDTVNLIRLVVDPKEGRDITIWREADEGKFEKLIEPFPRPIAETDEEIQKILEKTVNLENYLKPITEEDLPELKKIAKEFDLYLQTKFAEVEEDDLDIPNEFDEQNNKKEDIEETKECFGKFDITSEECINCDLVKDCMAMTN